MPPPNQDRRDDVLHVAANHAWKVESRRTVHGAMSDRLVRSGTTVTCFWAETPWSDARWHGAVVTDNEGSRQVWAVGGRNGILQVLA